MSPIRCNACASPIALQSGDRLTCPSCQQTMPVPPDLREAQAHLETRIETLRTLVPLWRRIGTAPPAAASWLGIALLLLLPSCTTGAAALTPWGIEAPALIAAAVTFPSVLPGAALWLRAAAIRITVMQVQHDMSATPAQDGTHNCRSCGAPLAASPESVACSCGYCGADSVIRDLPQAEESRSKSQALIKTLDEATAILQRRRVLITVGLATMALPTAGASMAIGIGAWLLWSP